MQSSLLIKDASLRSRRRPLQKKKRKTNENAKLLSPFPKNTSTNTSPTLRFREHCGRDDQKHFKSQRIKEFSVRLCLLVTLTYFLSFKTILCDIYIHKYCISLCLILLWNYVNRKLIGNRKILVSGGHPSWVEINTNLQ